MQCVCCFAIVLFFTNKALRFGVYYIPLVLFMVADVALYKVITGAIRGSDAFGAVKFRLRMPVREKSATLLYTVRRSVFSFLRLRMLLRATPQDS